VPNKRRLDMHVAESLCRDAATEVIVAPPVAVFSQWVEDLLVTIYLLGGKPAPASVDAGSLIQLWAEALDGEMVFLAEGERNLAALQARAADRLLQHWWMAKTPPGWNAHSGRHAISLQKSCQRATRSAPKDGWKAWRNASLRKQRCPATCPCRSYWMVSTKLPAWSKRYSMRSRKRG
jgi:hypothetical protein